MNPDSWPRRPQHFNRPDDPAPSPAVARSAEPGRAKAPAVCQCQHSLLAAGCQCPGYVPYKQRSRGY